MCVWSYARVCVPVSKCLALASVEHSQTVQNGGSAWPTEGFIGHLGHLASHFRCFPAVFPLFSRCFPSVFPLFSRCFPAVSSTIKRQEEPRGIVSVTPWAMGAKVVQEEPRGCTGGTARDRVCVCHATGDGCEGWTEAFEKGSRTGSGRLYRCTPCWFMRAQVRNQ